MTIRCVGIVGGGTMGQGIAISCALAGLDVLLCDKDLPHAEHAKAGIGEELDRDIAKWRHTQSEKNAVLARVKPVAKLPELEQAQLVIEAVPENLALKAGIFGELSVTTYPLHDAAKAHVDMAERKKAGALVLVP